MLSKESLSQLTNLKQTLRDNTDYQVGTVKSTSGRFGFAVLDDGREAFLSPEQMNHVFHGDVIEVIVEKNDKNQCEAKLNKLIKSSLKHVVGEYIIRGKGHFVVADTDMGKTWLFVPPKFRRLSGKTVENGDKVSASITQHPYKTGKSQAKITKILGSSQSPFIDRTYTLEKYGLTEEWSDSVKKQVSDIVSKPYPDTKHDHTHLDFVTIDSASTKDMDDALAIEKHNDGWVLWVAIANPGSEISLDSPLARAMEQKAHTVYFLGRNLPMMPEELSTDRYSLLKDQIRPAIVSKLTIDNHGQLTDAMFYSSKVSSKAKLSYAQVSALLTGEDHHSHPHLDDALPFKPMLEQLYECSQQINQHRKQTSIVTEHPADYNFHTNNRGLIESIDRSEKLLAHRLVEEAMLLVNKAAGDALANKKTGLFSTHLGFKAERRPDIDRLLSEKLERTLGDTSLLNEYVALIQELQNTDNHALLSICQRFLQPSELSLLPSPHFGLGVSHYAMISSPIRRYQDFYNQHQLVIQLLDKPTNEQSFEIDLDQLKMQIQTNREAKRYLEQRLAALYMKDSIGSDFKARVTLLNNQGIGLKLVDSGIEAFVSSRKQDKKKPEQLADKLSFNNQRMELNWNGELIPLDSEIDVKLIGVDLEKNRLVCEWPNAPLPIATTKKGAEA